MSGTGATSREEFRKVYGLDVTVMPTHKPMVRRDSQDMVYRSEKGKHQAVLRKVKELHDKGQPVLLGTGSIEKNEVLSSLLDQVGISHKTLNAKNHEAEAQIIAQAGAAGAVTLATNIAGRGVDIVLGGNPPDVEAAKQVKAAGGLFVLGTERHEARRIDNQLRGRAGRQGDPGESQFFVSLEDDLMRVFGGDKIKNMMRRFNIPEDEAINSSLVSRAIEAAQAKIEGYHFDARKHILEYDEVMNKHREVVYRLRREFIGLASEARCHEKIRDILREEAAGIVLAHFSEPTGEYDLAGIAAGLGRVVPAAPEVFEDLVAQAASIKNDSQKLTDFFMSFVEKSYEAREAQLGSPAARQVEKLVLLRTIDELWMNHLEEMEYIRDSVGLRAYGQRDPLVEYKTEGHRLFRDFLGAFESEVAGLIFKVGIAPVGARGLMRNNTRTNADNIGEHPHDISDNQRSGVKLGRNDPCPCGAKKPDGRPVKYKHCHGV